MVGNLISDLRKEGRTWKNIEIDDKVYLICFISENESYEILLTNLIEIWTDVLTEETMFRTCQTLNPLLNLEGFDWKQLIIDMLNDIPNHVIEASVHRIMLQKNKDFVKLKFSLNFHNGTQQQFWENITKPFCLSSVELIRRHEILLNLVKRKDEEIAEYKAEGAELIRKYIATEPFSEELFKDNNITSVKTDFIKIFQSMLCFYNTINLPKTEVKIKCEFPSNYTSGDNISMTSENVLPKNECLQKSEQNELDKDKEYTKNKKCESESNPSTSHDSILKLSNTSYTIQKSLKKHKKSLSDFIL